MGVRIFSEREWVRGHQWSMHSGEMLQALGLKPGGHLPADGLPPRELQGVTVYVAPAAPAASGRKSSRHRVMAVCSCGRHVSAGRLHQHRCPAGVR